MPIATISSDTNKDRAAVVSRMLDRGGRSLSQMLGEAIKTGRSTVDNQARQEQAFLTEQRREINLKQRRAEAAQQDTEDTRKFNEEKRRFDLKFGQDGEAIDERFRQAELDRDVRREQVTGNLQLGAEQNAISRTNSATSVFNAETSRINAQTSAERAAIEKESAAASRAQDSATAEREAGQQRAQETFTQEFNKLSPEQKKARFLEEGLTLGFDSTTRRILASEAGIGATPEQLGAVEGLPPARKAQAEGVLDALEDLEKQRAIGTQVTNPTTGAKEFQRLSPSEFTQRRKELEQELEKITTGSRGTADSLFDRVGNRIRQ